MCHLPARIMANLRTIVSPASHSVTPPRDASIVSVEVLKDGIRGLDWRCSCGRDRILRRCCGWKIPVVAFLNSSRPNRVSTIFGRGDKEMIIAV